jgi:hypothetical protein
MTDENDAGLRDHRERLDQADALYQSGNITAAAALAHGVEEELERVRKRAAVGSALRNECMLVLKRARSVLDRLETAAAIDDDEADEDE